MAEQTIDQEKLAYIRQELNRAGGAHAIEQRYGESVTSSPEYQAAQRHQRQMAERQRKARMAAVEDQEVDQQAAQHQPEGRDDRVREQQHAAEAQRQAEQEQQRQAEVEHQQQLEAERQAELQQRVEAEEQQRQETAQEAVQGDDQSPADRSAPSSDRARARGVEGAERGSDQAEREGSSGRETGSGQGTERSAEQAARDRERERQQEAAREASAALARGKAKSQGRARGMGL